MREMKDSGVEWIGYIPASWQTLTVGSLFKVRNEKVNDTDYPPLSVTKSGVVPQMENVAKSDANDNRKMVLANDFVINSRSDRKQSCGVSSLDGSVSLINTVLYPAKGVPIVPEYLNYLLKNYGFAEEFYRWGHGIVADLWTTRWQEMKSILLPIPSMEEQQQILNAISTQIKKVDSLIANMQAQIEKLKAYKQSLITEVVTKGLDPSVPMKDSEVEWIGCYPNRWRLSHIGKVAEMGAGGTPSRNNPEYWDNGSIPWMSSGEINYEYVYDTSEKITELGMKNSNAKLLPINTVMLGLIGQGRTKGLSAILKIECTCNQNLAYLIANPTFLHYEYLFYCFKAMYSYIRGVVGESQAGIYQGFLKMQYIPLPSTSEQIMISNYLNEKCSQIDHLIAIKQAKIEKLEQYKRSLIYEYVTGKKEVR